MWLEMFYVMEMMVEMLKVVAHEVADVLAVVVARVAEVVAVFVVGAADVFDELGVYDVAEVQNDGRPGGVEVMNDGDAEMEAVVVEVMVEVVMQVQVQAVMKMMILLWLVFGMKWYHHQQG
jgi:hypothetical protein